jgi:hypothetical protein
MKWNQRFDLRTDELRISASLFSDFAAHFFLFSAVQTTLGPKIFYNDKYQKNSQHCVVLGKVWRWSK